MTKNNNFKQTCFIVTGSNEIEDISGSIDKESGSVITSINNSTTSIINHNKNLTNIDEIGNEKSASQIKNNKITNQDNNNITNTSITKTLDSSMLQPEIPKIFIKNPFDKLVYFLKYFLNRS